MKDAKRPTLTGAIVDAVARIGEASVSQVVAEVGDLIPSALAANWGRRCVQRHERWKPIKVPRMRSARELVDAGRREAVAKCLRELLYAGRLRRVRRGVYCLHLRLVGNEAG